MLVDLGDLFGALSGSPDEIGALDGRLDIDEMFDASNIGRREMGEVPCGAATCDAPHRTSPFSHLPSSLDGHALGEITRLIDVRAPSHGDMVGQQL